MNPAANDAQAPDGDLIFVDDQSDATAVRANGWKVLIADDEPDLHIATKLALQGFSFKDRPLEFLDAYTGAEACAILQAHPDTAVIFLDVVMETDDAGLRAVRRIREELGNHMVRIILRTGQPGHAPEEDVVVNYHINDYKAKTEMTAKKLFTSLISALRSYHDLQSIDANRRGLLKIIDAASSMDFRSRGLFASGLLTQLSSLLDVGESDLVLIRRGEAGKENRIMAASGVFESFIGEPINGVLDADSVRDVAQVFSQRQSLIADNRSIFNVPLPHNRDVALYVNRLRPVSEAEYALMSVFCQKIALAFENYDAVEQARHDQNAELALLSRLYARTREHPVSYAVNTGRLARDIAHQLHNARSPLEIDSHLPETIERAAMLADLGNILVPAEILETPGPLTPEQTAIVRKHPEFGAGLIDEVLSQVKGGRVIHTARQIALGHHERHDGGGYPARLAGDAIPLAARITAVADSYMALTSKRPWREAYPHDEAVGMIRSDAGGKFDPSVVDAFMAVSGYYRPN